MKLWHYIQGNRKGKEAHRIEKEAMKDPFLADALEGYEKTQGNHQREVAKLQKSITKLQKQETNRMSGKKSNHLKIWGIAAGILIIVGAGTWFALNDSPLSKESQSIAQVEIQANQPIIPEESLMPPLPDTTEVLPKKKAQPIAAAKEKTMHVSEDATISTTPQPVPGMNAYMEYVQRNLKRPADEECRNAKGSVVVIFKIGESGRPYNIRVSQGLCASCNKEAIRLIINGPNWKKGTASDEASITINF